MPLAFPALLLAAVAPEEGDRLHAPPGERSSRSQGILGRVHAPRWGSGRPPARRTSPGRGTPSTTSRPMASRASRSPVEDDGAPFETRTARLVATLDEQFAEARRVEDVIRQDLGYPGMARRRSAEVSRNGHSLTRSVTSIMVVSLRPPGLLRKDAAHLVGFSFEGTLP